MYQLQGLELSWTCWESQKFTIARHDAMLKKANFRYEEMPRVICHNGFSLIGDTGSPDEVRKLDLGHHGRTTSVIVSISPVCEVGIEAIPL